LQKGALWICLFAKGGFVDMPIYKRGALLTPPFLKGGGGILNAVNEILYSFKRTLPKKKVRG
jgi:hypothetical protein